MAPHKIQEQEWMIFRLKEVNIKNMGVLRNSKMTRSQE